MACGHTRSIGGSSDGNMDTKIRLQASLTRIFVSIFPPFEQLPLLYRITTKNAMAIYPNVCVKECEKY